MFGLAGAAPSCSWLLSTYASRAKALLVLLPWRYTSNMASRRTRPRSSFVRSPSASIWAKERRTWRP